MQGLPLLALEKNGTENITLSELHPLPNNQHVEPSHYYS